MKKIIMTPVLCIVLAAAVIAPVGAAAKSNHPALHQAAVHYLQAHPHHRGLVALQGTASNYDATEHTVTVTVQKIKVAGNAKSKKLAHRLVGQQVTVQVADNTRFVFLDKSAASETDLATATNVAVAGRFAKVVSWPTVDGKRTPVVNAKGVAIKKAANNS